jgi:hypothetical protein
MPDNTLRRRIGLSGAIAAALVVPLLTATAPSEARAEADDDYDEAGFCDFMGCTYGNDKCFDGEADWKGVKFKAKCYDHPV